MSWTNPWAWLGLATLAVPVLIHLMTRHRARVQPFPTLRFVEASRRVPIRPAQPRDAWLMLLRVCILAVAVAALAGPRLESDARADAAARTLSRVIVIDTSASMQRPTPAGERAIDAARREAERFADDAAAVVRLESAAPAGLLEGAAAWLRTQPGMREIVVVSDFQAGAVGAADLAAVPNEIGVAFHRIDTAPHTSPLEWNVGGVAVARFAFEDGATEVEWKASSAGAAETGVVQLAGPSERDRAEAALDAALAMAAPIARRAHRAGDDVGFVATEASDRAITIVYPGYEGRAALLAAAEPLNATWMSDVVVRVASAAPIAAAAGSRASTERDRDPLPFTDAGRVAVDGRDRLLVFAAVDAGTLADAALLSAILESRDAAPPITELEPRRVPDDTLAAWQRPAAAIGTDHASDDASDARWLWLVVLLLLGLETWARRDRRSRGDEA